jgi:hypothetical protein
MRRPLLLVVMLLTTTGFVRGFAATHAAGHPDDPLPTPADRKVFSPDHRFYFNTRVRENRTDVFAAGKPAAPLWTLPMYLDEAFLSNDGRHIAAEYPGGNILDASVKPSDTLFTFYSPGALPRLVSVGSVVGDLQKLPRTSSGYGWGNAVGFDRDGWFVVMLSDRRTVRLDPNRSQPESPQPHGPSQTR